MTPDALYEQFTRHVYQHCAACRTGDLCPEGHRLGELWFTAERGERQHTVARNLARDYKTDLWDARDEDDDS